MTDLLQTFRKYCSYKTTLVHRVSLIYWVWTGSYNEFAQNCGISETEITEPFERYILTSSVKLTAFCALITYDTSFKMHDSVIDVSLRCSSSGYSDRKTHSWLFFVAIFCQSSGYLVNRLEIRKALYIINFILALHTFIIFRWNFVCERSFVSIIFHESLK